MRTSAVLALTLLLLFAIPGAAAHVTVTATRPEGRIPIGTPTEITATASANCAAGIADYQAMNRGLRFGLDAAAPSWLTWTGQNVTMTASQCGTDGNMKNSGKISITPGPLAPGLQEVNIKVVAYAGTENHGEATVPITVAYRGELNITGPSVPEIMLDNGTATVDLLLNASINADSMAMIEVITPPEFGTLNIPTSVDIASPLIDNQTYRVVPFQFAYQADPGGNFTMDMIAIRILMHAQADAGAAAPPQELMFHFMMVEHDDDVPEDREEGAPALDASLIVASLVAIALFIRRRK